MSETAYASLQSLTESGRLELIHLVAPPRSSSTALERALSNSPDVVMQVNDPWSLYDENREPQTYQYILGRVQAALPATETARVVIKDIADYIPPGEPWSRMTGLVKHTIFLVREPLLALESMMQIMAKEVPAAAGEAYAHSAGYDSWPAMQEKVTAKRDYRSYEALYEGLFRDEQPIHTRLEMQVPVLVATPLSLIQRRGYDTHNAYAAAKGFGTWKQLCDALVGGVAAPTVCDDLIEENFKCRITGWTAMWQHFKSMPDDASYDVVDATMFRALPASFLPDVFDRAQLRFSSGVVDWKTSSKTFNSDYDGEVPYYDKVIQSTGIAPPTETPIPVENFPRFIQESLVGDEGAFDIYQRFLEHIIRRLSAERRQALLTVTAGGQPLQKVDPVFYDLINKKGQE